MEDNYYWLYVGEGIQRKRQIPPYREISGLDDPAGYLADKGLRNAVNVALMLGQPLLITGEPGTGKTQLAASVAYELALPDASRPEPLVFNTKTTSKAKDLFYRYDALGHFHDAYHSDEKPFIENYIEYEALGLAILLSLSPDDPQRKEINYRLPEKWQNTGAVRSVVLIDEIDKAPPDLPNDILNEVERMSFTVTETGRSFRASQSFRPVVILTSNLERDLPNAFLRRCAFYHIDFPDKERLIEIVRRRLTLDTGFTQQMLEKAVDHFIDIRKQNLRKKPATAELLAWLIVLEKSGINVRNAKPAELKHTYPVLLKSQEDIDLVSRMFEGQQRS